MKKVYNKTYLIGYGSKEIKIFTTPLKPLGYVVAGLGYVCLGVAVFPNGLGLVFYPLGFGLLGVVGIRLNIKRKLSDKVRLFKYKRGWL